MGNGVLYTFMATEILFVIGGVLLIVLSITTKAASNAKQNIDTIANTLLLPQRLLTGTYGSPKKKEKEEEEKNIIARR